MGIQPMDIVIHIINIVVLYALLRILLYKPVSAFMQARQATIARSLDTASKAKLDADALKKEFDARIKAADDEAQQHLLEGTQRAGEAANAIVQVAQQQATDILAKAHKQAQEEREQMVASLEPQVTDMAVHLASQILRREVNQGDNQKVIQAFFDKVV